MKKAFIFCVVMVALIVSSNAQSPSYYTLATDNGIFLQGSDAKVKMGNMESVTFHLSPNKEYSLKFQGTDEVEFVVDGTTFSGFVDRITITTGDNPQTLVMFIKGKGKYSYALGLL